jgi:hypothetical protein
VWATAGSPLGAAWRLEYFLKSHTGCLLNERADELAELGRQAEGPEIGPGPQLRKVWVFLVASPADIVIVIVIVTRQPESSGRTVTRPCLETVLQIAVFSRRWRPSIPCEQS